MKKRARLLLCLGVWSFGSFARAHFAFASSSPLEVDSLEVTSDSLRSQDLVTRLFGKGGFKMKVNGTVEMDFGLFRNRYDNPSLRERDRTDRYFRFRPKVRTNAQMTLGERLSMQLNYDTNTTLSSDAKSIKLVYQGGSNELFKLVEAGHVGFSSHNALMQGVGALFGVRTELRFSPHLTMEMTVGQTQAERRTVQLDAGHQRRDFELRASDYDESRHYFLSRYFADHYDEVMAGLPHIQSDVRIQKIEVWVINRRGGEASARNICALADLAEAERVFNPSIMLSGDGVAVPHNQGNSLGSLVSSRDFSLLDPSLQAGRDVERLQSARRLSEEDYHLNPALGFISLNQRLSSDETLAVAYEYTYRGQTYKVGEFVSDRDDSSVPLLTKLLKGSATAPGSACWDYEMRNVYALPSGWNVTDVESFRLDIHYRSDDSGLFSPYLPSGHQKGIPLVRLVGADQVNRQGQRISDGRFDYLEGYTVDSRRGLIYLPGLEPFGRSLERVEVEQEWLFTELYIQSKTQAKTRLERDKYVLRGSYTPSEKGVLYLGRGDLRAGTVRVEASGTPLVEDVDFVVDYLTGRVSILNTNLIEQGASISASIDDPEAGQKLRQTFAGVDLRYAPSSELRVNLTAMYLHESAKKEVVRIGSEPLRNFQWGGQVIYQKQLPWLSKALNAIPWQSFSAPSVLNTSVQFAHLITDVSQDRLSGGYSYLDDFEQAETGVELGNPYAWTLGSNPRLSESGGQATSSVESGYGRGHLSWYSIDPAFTYEDRRRGRIGRYDASELSNHFVRPIETRELYPYRDLDPGAANYLKTFDLSYYPRERGAYNLEIDRFLPNGQLSNPKDSWASLMRPLKQTDLEAAGVEYLEFWLMDPFVYDRSSRGGRLSIHLGDISEDVLADGIHSSESALPTDDREAQMVDTPWGRMPERESLTGAFEVTEEKRRLQDIGLDGLSTAEELKHPSYSSYVNRLRSRLSGEVISRWEMKSHSPLTDPAGDDFRHYLSEESDLDGSPISLLDRYKYYNGMEGNSSSAESSDVARLRPNAEDINQDQTLNETNRYYEYKIELSSERLANGSGGYLLERKIRPVRLMDGTQAEVSWCRFRIPLRKPTATVGSPDGLRSVRFVRMALEGFEDETHLRFYGLKFVREEWRKYEGRLDDQGGSNSEEVLSISSVGLETDGDRSPINYVPPPGVVRSIDHTTGQGLRQGEQGLRLRLDRMNAESRVGIYRTMQYDLLPYAYLELFIHAESLAGAIDNAGDDELKLFVRLGTDAEDNYYEYEQPLKLTAQGRYRQELQSDREKVWPLENKLRIPLSELPDLKLKRRNLGSSSPSGGASAGVFSLEDPNSSRAVLSIKGNPSLASVRTLIIGVRNPLGETRSIEVWIDELRLSGRNNKGGWAAQTDLSLQLSDLGSVRFEGAKSTAGFGMIQDSYITRSRDDRVYHRLTTRADLGKLLPKEAKASIPIYYSRSRERLSPLFDPLEGDLKLQRSLDAVSDNTSRDAIISSSIKVQESSSFSLSAGRIGIRSRKAMPYDPANFSFSYSRQERNFRSPELQYRRSLITSGGITYDFSPELKPLMPFSRWSGEGRFAQHMRRYGLQLAPYKIHLETTLLHSYEEEQVRSPKAIGDASTYLPSYSGQFSWSRKMNLMWRPLPSLHLSLSTGTDARIEDGNLQVNRELNPDDYAKWRDRIGESLRELGTPIRYAQTSTLSYSAPTEAIAWLDWTKLQYSYTGSYTWSRGADLLDTGGQMPGVITNQGDNQTNIRLFFSRLYDKSRYLRSLGGRRRGLKPSQPAGEERIAKPFLARLSEGMLILLMGLRDVSISYRQSHTSYIPGFEPLIGDFFGQRAGGRLSPGLKFALGWTDEGYFDKAKSLAWLADAGRNTLPAVYSKTKSFDMKIQLEPIRDLNITLTGVYSTTNRGEYQYMYDDAGWRYGGSLVMTTIGLRGILSTPKAEDGYMSEAFDRFIAHQLEIRERHLGQLSAASADGSLQPTLDLNSPAVLIPSFRAAYSLSGGAKGVGLSPLPRLLSLLPNWTVSYRGLPRVLGISHIVPTISLRHSYSGTYRVNSYTSLSGWMSIGSGGLGMLSDKNAGNSLSLSLPIEVGSVSIQEQLFPLLGVDLRLRSGLGLRYDWRRTRSMTLSPSSLRLIETYSHEQSIGISYTVIDLMRMLRPSLKEKDRAGKAISPRSFSLTLDYGYKSQLSLIRSLDRMQSRGSSGVLEHSLRFGADCQLSKYLGLKAYYEWRRHTPLASNVNFPLSNRSYGAALRLMLP